VATAPGKAQRCPKPVVFEILRDAQCSECGVEMVEAGRNLEERDLTAAVVAAVRHKHTEYDKLLERGMNRSTARQTVGDKIEEVLAAWRT
jgi:hypothetical protein